MLAGTKLDADMRHRNFTDVFKTPGKMRGKTPRTARKRNAEESRVVSDKSCRGRRHQLSV